MPLERLIHQPRARALIERMVQGNRLPHALLFWGPAGSGKSAAGIELARWLNCRQGLSGPCGQCDACRQFATLEHPHLSYLMPLPAKALVNSDEGELTEEGAENLSQILRRKGQEPYRTCDYRGGQFILIGQIRSLLQWAGKRTFDNLPQLALIDRADHLREEAANALLKLLEEPPPNFLLLLTAEAQEDILPTLRSRCQAVEFEALPDAVVSAALQLKTGLGQNQCHTIARLCAGNLSRALEFAADPPRAAQLYDQAINLVRYSLGRNPLEFHSVLEKWAATELPEQHLMLEIVTTWLRDAALLQSLGSAASLRLIHQDRVELLSKFVANCPHADFAAAVLRVEEARRRLSGKVLAPLVLVALARDLYRTIYGRQPV
jgi:DNA polymerase-3 subunit delta'